VGNSLILQHSLSRAGSPRPQTWNIGVGSNLVIKLCQPGFELETSGFDTILSCMHRPVQPKSLSWWGKVGNSLILQHFGSPTVSYVHSSPANPWLTLFNIEGPHQSWIGSISLEVLSTASSIRWFHLFIWMKQFPQVETVSSDQKIASLIDIISPCILLFLSIHKVHIPHIITATSILRHAISCLHWRGWTNLLTVFGIT